MRGIHIALIGLAILICIVLIVYVMRNADYYAEFQSKVAAYNTLSADQRNANWGAIQDSAANAIRFLFAKLPAGSVAKNKSLPFSSTVQAEVEVYKSLNSVIDALDKLARQRGMYLGKSVTIGLDSDGYVAQRKDGVADVTFEFKFMTQAVQNKVVPIYHSTTSNTSNTSSSSSSSSSSSTQDVTRGIAAGEPNNSSGGSTLDHPVEDSGGAPPTDNVGTIDGTGTPADNTGTPMGGTYAIPRQTLTVTPSNSIVMSSGKGLAVETTAVDGYVYLPSMEGQPKGNPAQYDEGKNAPMIYDSTNKALEIYDNKLKSWSPYYSFITSEWYTGAGVFKATAQFDFWKVGPVVSCRIRAVSGSLDMETTYVGTKIAFPEAFRPTRSTWVYIPMHFFNGGTPGTVLGNVLVTTSGIFQFQCPWKVGNVGWPECVVQWFVG